MPCGPVGGHLLADGEVQPHVQPGIQLPAARRIVGEIGRGRFHDDVIFGMLGDHRDDLLVERRQRVLLLEPAPRGAIGLAQLVARLAGENHGAFLAAAMILRRSGYSHRFVHEAACAFWLQCLADVAAMQDEPVMCVMSEFPGRELDQCVFHFSRSFAAGDPHAVGDAEYVCVHGYCRLAEDCVQYHVRSFATHSRKFFEFARACAALRPACSSAIADAVATTFFALSLPQADRADVLRESIDAEFRNSLWSTGNRKQFARRGVHALVGGLGRQDHRHQQLEWRLVFELGGRMRIRGAKSLEDLRGACAGSWARSWRRPRAAFLGGERGGAFRGAARDAFVVGVVTRARVLRQAAATSDGNGLASSGIMTMQSTGQGATHSSQPVHSSAIDRVHAPRRADDGIHRAGRQALGAADAAFFVDERDGRRGFEAVVAIERRERPPGERRQRDDGFGAARRALVDVGFAARDRFGIGQATGVAAARALGLRQQRVDGGRGGPRDLLR